MSGIIFNDKDFQAGISRFEKQAVEAEKRGRFVMGDTLLLLSRFEVPHDKGTLQSSGNVSYDAMEDAVIVAYNTVYAAFVHEGFGHRNGKLIYIRNYQKGRKKKYLEDPLLLNRDKWERIAHDNLAQLLTGRA